MHNQHSFVTFVVQTVRKVRILLLDNIDSFTYNIFHYLEALENDVIVTDNLAVRVEDLDHFDALIVSPGPGLPAESGRLMELLAGAVERKMPVLGVCLGMQAIAEHFGGTLYNQKEVKHGQAETISHKGESRLFKGIPEVFTVGLYHSWAVSEPLPEKLKATSYSENGVMMSLEHETLPVYGVQFHPESILSQYGMELFENFLNVAAYRQ